MSSARVTTLQQWSSSRSPPDASPGAFSSSLTTTVFSQRSMRRLEASPRRAAPKGQQSFISRTAPHQGTHLPTWRAPFCVRDTRCGSSGVSCRPASAGPGGRRLRAHPSRPAGPSRRAGPGGPSRRAAAAPVTAPQPPRCDIVTVRTATMSHRGGSRAAASPPGAGRLSGR